jgi:PhnB protein
MSRFYKMHNPDWTHAMINSRLNVRDADKAVEFYRASFGARPVSEPYRDETGHVSHTEIAFPDRTRISLRDDQPEKDFVDAGRSVMLVLEVEDVHATALRFMAAGGRSMSVGATGPDGVRSGRFEDPFGHVWFCWADRRGARVSRERPGGRVGRIAPPATGPTRSSPRSRAARGMPRPSRTH